MEKTAIIPSVIHIQDKAANNRAENSHQPTREREWRRRRFLSAFSTIANHFRSSRHLQKAGYIAAW